MSSKRAMKDLSQIQDACIRLVSKKPKTAKVDQLYRDLKILRLQDLLKLELAKYGHKITHKLYPDTLNKLADANGGKKTLRYPTWYKQTPHIQKHKTKEFNNSHLCKGLTVYNCMLKELKTILTLKLFI